MNAAQRKADDDVQAALKVVGDLQVKMSQARMNLAHAQNVRDEAMNQDMREWNSTFKTGRSQ